MRKIHVMTTEQTAPNRSATSMGLIALGVLVGALVVLLAVLSIRRYQRKQSAQREVYSMTALGGMEDDEEAFFDDTITEAAPARLLQNDFNLRLSDDEDDYFG